MKRIIPASLFVLCATLAFADDAAEASFGTPFTSHAVLQRDCRLPVWGFATPGSRLTPRASGRSSFRR